VINQKGLFLEESILIKVLCYWISSRLCTSLSCCASQGVFSIFLEPVWFKICVVSL